MSIHTVLLSIQSMTVLISETSERIQKKNNVLEIIEAILLSGQKLINLSRTVIIPPSA